MAKQLQFKYIAVIIVIASIGIGPLWLFISKENSMPLKYSYNFSKNTAFYQLVNPTDNQINFGTYDLITQYRYIRSVEREFMVTILHYFSQNPNKEAISSVNKAYPKDWQKLQECTLQINRNGEPFTFNVIVSTDKKSRMIFNALFYSVKDKVYKKKFKAKIASIASSFFGDSSISVIAVTFRVNPCKEEDVDYQNGINDMLNVIEQNRHYY